METKSNPKLEVWQDRLAQSDRYWDSERQKMDRREELYRGKRDLEPLVPGDTNRDGSKRRTSHIRNIIFENIESQISSSIPQPKVIPRRQEDERLAEMIEHFLRNELERQKFAEMNDQAERTVPIQGGVGWQVEWDERKRTHITVGEAVVSMVHPKQLAPQPGIYTGIEDMDWVIVKVPTTKSNIKRRYGVSVDEEKEAEPEIRAAGAEDLAEDAVTMYVGYERGENGINKYVWCNDIELEELDNYQARRVPVCSHCGMAQPLPGQLIYGVAPRQQQDDGMLEEQIAQKAIQAQMADAVMQGREDEFLPGMDFGGGVEPQGEYKEGGPCPYCGSEEWTDQEQEYEQIVVPMETDMGVQIPGARAGIDEDGNAVIKPTLIPFYRPDVFPFVLQRSVSVYGQLLGNSDVDIIADQQNTVNRIEQKIITRLVKAGTRITLPPEADIRLDPEDGEKIYLESPAQKAMIDVLQFSGDLNYELRYLAQVYEEARQLLGITDSFQGRKDSTATSAVAKEFAAQQAAGRLESKRTMKNAAYSRLFELMFKFWLAYGDEPRPVSYTDWHGDTKYEHFNRYDFLQFDEDGTPWWNDLFVFTTDNAAPLESNRQALWQETRMNLQTGAFGDPTQTDTLILFWQKMEALHYPGAGETKQWLEARAEREQQMMMQQQAMQQQAMMQQAAMQQPMQAAPAQQMANPIGI